MRHPFGRCEMLRAGVADVGFGRSHSVAWRRLWPISRDAYGTLIQTGSSIFFKQHLDHTLGLVIFAFAEVVIANSPLRINEVIRGPVFVAEGIPDRMVAVDRYGVRNSQVNDGI